MSRIAFSVSATNAAQVVFKSSGSAPVADGATGTNFPINGWATSSSNLTGTQTLTYKVTSSAVTTTQTLTLHSYSIRKIATI